MRLRLGELAVPAMAAILFAGCSEILKDFTFYDLADGGIDAGGQGDGDAGTPDGGMPDARTDAGPPDAGPPVPTAPNLRWPPNAYATGSARTAGLSPPLNAARPTFRWDEVEGAERYEIALSSQCMVGTREACAFDGAVTGETTSTDFVPEAALDIATTAPRGRRYYWRVRACNVAGCSAWSVVRFVDVGRLASDVTGDGLSDVVVGNPFATVDGQTNAGRASILLGPDLSVATVSLEEASPTASAQFGETAQVVGDINGDGFADMVVAAPTASVAGRARAGRAVLFLGGPLGSGGAHELAAPVPFADEHFGRAVAALGDANGDGFRDLAVGAPGNESASGAAGAVYVFQGTSAGVDEARRLATPGAVTGGAFGASLAWADMNGDGYWDLVVGAPGESGGATGRAGRVYAYWGSSTGLLEPAIAIESAVPTANVSFGIDVDAGEDVDGDGFADVVVAERNNGDVCSSPSFHVIFGAPTSDVGVRRENLACPSWGMNFGDGAVAIGRDATGDGLADLVAASQTFRMDQSRAFEGSASFAFGAGTTLPGCGAFGNIGELGFGDFEGDGVDEVTMVVPRDRVCLIDPRAPASVSLSVAAP